MTPDEAKRITGVGRSTITGWTSGEFRIYFSPTAQAADGRARDLTEHDVRLLVLLKSLTDARQPRESIHATLRQLEANDWNDLPAMPQNRSAAVVPMLPVAAADAALISERRMYVAQIELLKEQLEQANQQAQQAREHNEPLLREIGDLKAEKARLELLIELYEQGRLKPKGE